MFLLSLNAFAQTSESNKVTPFEIKQILVDIILLESNSNYEDLEKLKDNATRTMSLISLSYSEQEVHSQILTAEVVNQMLIDIIVLKFEPKNKKLKQLKYKAIRAIKKTMPVDSSVKSLITNHLKDESERYFTVRRELEFKDYGRDFWSDYFKDEMGVISMAGYNCELVKLLDEIEPKNYLLQEVFMDLVIEDKEMFLSHCILSYQSKKKQP